MSAVAGTLDQRGEVLGELITLTETYLTSFNPSLPALSKDLRRVDDVAAVYDLAREDLITTFDGAATTLETLVQQQASLRALELSLTSFSSKGDTLLRDSGEGLSTSLRLLDPVTGTLARYSPELPCLIEGLAKGNELAEPRGGRHQPWHHDLHARGPRQGALRVRDRRPRVGREPRAQLLRTALCDSGRGRADLRADLRHRGEPLQGSGRGSPWARRHPRHSGNGRSLTWRRVRCVSRNGPTSSGWSSSSSSRHSSPSRWQP
ncbi:hypothetical protein G5V59_19020 [Nocardioides sp. W3-2-3]|nr:hypothetical protein [Nocardioides convexus]